MIQKMNLFIKLFFMTHKEKGTGGKGFKDLSLYLVCKKRSYTNMKIARKHVRLKTIQMMKEQGDERKTKWL